jgi:hypothetical protein
MGYKFLPGYLIQGIVFIRWSMLTIQKIIDSTRGREAVYDLNLRVK